MFRRASARIKQHLNGNTYDKVMFGWGGFIASANIYTSAKKLHKSDNIDIYSELGFDSLRATFKGTVYGVAWPITLPATAMSWVFADSIYSNMKNLGNRTRQQYAIDKTIVLGGSQMRYTTSK
jgi:hypothetical protein